MNPQITAALLILAGPGAVTVAFFLIIHNRFQSALMPNKASNTSKDPSRYVGRIY